MDPNANLKEQQRLSAELLEGNEDGIDPIKAYRLAELVEALDGWIRRGGFLPTDWVK